MTLLQTFRIAWRALRRNALRSFLTMLGVIIGVAAVIAMVAIGEGARFRVQQVFSSMGSNLIMILSGATSSGGARGGFGSLPTLTWEDLAAIRKEVPGVRQAAAVLRGVMPVSSEDQNWTTLVIGTHPEYFSLRNWRVAQGQLFGDAEQDGQAKVAVLGRTVAGRLFGSGTVALGQTVRIRNVPFRVIAVLEPKGQSPMGDDQDDAVTIPASTFQTKISGGLQTYIRGVIIVGAASAEATPRVEARIQDLLRDRHRLQPGQENDFSTRNLSELAGAQQQGTATLTALLASIAAVSLLVGGIGIMNIMLVSVTERTREIGLRMAVGARSRDILGQFLVEAVVLSLAGGLIGVVLGVATAERLAARFQWPLLVQPGMVLLAVGFSALVGVGFGLYPAYKASRLDPIEALRYE
jgi:putative ABC transport system permease protein